MNGTHEFYVQLIGTSEDAAEFYDDLLATARDLAPHYEVVLTDVGMTPIASDTHLKPV